MFAFGSQNLVPKVWEYIKSGDTFGRRAVTKFFKQQLLEIVLWSSNSFVYLIKDVVSCFALGGHVGVPTTWNDFPSHAGFPKLVPNPLSLQNVSKTILVKKHIASACLPGADSGLVLGVYTPFQERFCAPFIRQISIFIYNGRNLNKCPKQINHKSGPYTPAPPT
jgi:hypothetical protein